MVQIVFFARNEQLNGKMELIWEGKASKISSKLSDSEIRETHRVRFKTQLRQLLQQMILKRLSQK